MLNNLLDENFKINHTVIGKVVSPADIKNRSRLQVRLIGITSDEVLDKDCPWAEIKSVLFATDSEMNGITSVPDKDVYVYVDFLYGNPSHPLVTGIVRGAEDSSFLHTGESLDKTVFKIRNDNKIGPELGPLNDKTIYPKNNVIQTRRDNVIEMDDTDGNERISISIFNGSHFELRPDGSIQIKSVKDLYEIVKANIERYNEGNVNEETKGTNTKKVDGAVTENYSASYTQTAGSRTIQTPATVHDGDLIVTGNIISAGDILSSGIVKATDCISGSVSGNSHQHPETQTITGGPF